MLKRSLHLTSFGRANVSSTTWKAVLPETPGVVPKAHRANVSEVQITASLLILKTHRADIVEIAQYFVFALAGALPADYISISKSEHDIVPLNAGTRDEETAVGGDEKETAVLAYPPIYCNDD